MTRTDSTHCLLDCWAEILDTKKIDSRPLYSGVWNAQIEVTETGISYFSNLQDPMGWLERCSGLFGLHFTHWCGPELANLTCLTDYLRTEARADMAAIMYLDLYYLPYSAYYKVKHVPHSVIVEFIGGPEGWHIKDPYFEWQGTVPIELLAESFQMGFAVDSANAHPAEDGAVGRLLKQDIHFSPGRLLVIVERIVTGTVREHGGYAPEHLLAAVQEAGIIAKRYSGYQYVLDYLAERTGCDAKAGTEAVRMLKKGWESLMLVIARFSLLNQPVDLDAFRDKLDKLAAYERTANLELSRAMSLMEDKPPVQDKANSGG